MPSWAQVAPQHHPCTKPHSWNISINSVAIMLGSLRRLARMKARLCPKVLCDRMLAYRKLLSTGSSAASFVASFLQRQQEAVGLQSSTTCCFTCDQTLQHAAFSTSEDFSIKQLPTAQDAKPLAAENVHGIQAHCISCHTSLFAVTAEDTVQPPATGWHAEMPAVLCEQLIKLCQVHGLQQHKTAAGLAAPFARLGQQHFWISGQSSPVRSTGL